MPRPTLLRIGTRGSPMALFQAELVRARLGAAHPELQAEGAIETVVIRTTGDRVQDRALAEIGGKGLFTKEIEEALLLRRIDLAVHSMKDVQTILPDGFAIGCVLPRDDPRDAFLSPRARSLAELASGAVVGTASPRRAAQILNRRADLRIQPIRGNAGTRLRKLAAGECDATLLALAGLERLGEAKAATAILSIDEMLPAAAQGAIGAECRADDDRVMTLLAALDDAASSLCVGTERAMLAALGGSCRTPIAAFAELRGEEVDLRGLVITPDGRRAHRLRRIAGKQDAARLGAEIGDELRRLAGPDFFG